MDRRRWWLGAMVFGAVAAMTVTSAFLGGEQTRAEVVVTTQTPVDTTATATATKTATTEVTVVSTMPTVVEPTPSPMPVPVLDAASLAELGRGIELGVVMRDRQTGEDLFTYYADQQFDSASLVKILIALDTLANGREPVASVQKMLSTSDDTAASRMWSEGGGTRIVARWAKLIGLSGTTPPADPNRWGDTQTTAADVAAVYGYLFEDPNGSVVLKALDGMADYGADGFDQRYGIPAVATAAGRRWAVKQGWACCRGNRILHTTGVVGPDSRYVVVVLTGQPSGATYATAAARVTKIVTALLSDH